MQEEEEKDLAGNISQSIYIVYIYIYNILCINIIGLVEKMESALVMETSEPVHNIAHEEEEVENSEVDDDDIEEDMVSDILYIIFIKIIVIGL